MLRNLTRLPEVEQAFSRKALKRVCEAPERSFWQAYDMEWHSVATAQAPEDFYLYKDNGSNVLAVAHLDTVAYAEDRTCRFVTTEGAGTVVYSRALDDRLGAYIILELLPKLGLTYDVLLTVGEESGQSTAQFFTPPPGKNYDYMIEFDRGGTDVVMYQYEDSEVTDLVRRCGAKVGDGSFSDISYLGHLGIKGFNWGVGYRDYHGPRAHAFLDDTFAMVARYLTFAEQNEGVYMPHYEEDEPLWYRRSNYRPWWEDEANIKEADDYPDSSPWPSGREDDDDPQSWNLDTDDVDAPDWNEHPSLSELNRYLDSEEDRDEHVA